MPSHTLALQDPLAQASPREQFPPRAMLWRTVHTPALHTELKQAYEELHPALAGKLNIAVHLLRSQRPLAQAESLAHQAPSGPAAAGVAVGDRVTVDEAEINTGTAAPPSQLVPGGQTIPLPLVEPEAQYQPRGATHAVHNDAP